jgi:hypothetical protein
MDTVDAIMMIEGSDMASPEEVLDAWQHLIDTAVVWSLQGSYQRYAIQLIEMGICSAPEYVEG